MEIKISNIELEQSAQCRAVMDQDTLDEYAEAMLAGDEFPPIEVYGTANKCWLADGWHRVLARRSITRETIEANMNHGGRTEAVKHGLAANKEHGLRRSPGDVARAIEIAYTEFPDSTQQQIADMVGCTQQHVSSVRRELTSSCNLPDKVTGKDGKQYPTSYSKPETTEANQEQDITTKEEPLPLEETTIEQEESPRSDTLFSETEKQKPTIDPERASMAMRYAYMAISQLERINKKDIHKQNALLYVKKWIEDNI